MLIVLAGSKGPVFSGPLIGVPRSVFVPRAPRLLLLDRAIWISTCSVNIRHSPASFHYTDTLRCSDFDAVTSWKLAVRAASQPLALGCDSRFGPITASGVGLADKRWPQGGRPACGDGMAIFLIFSIKTLTLSQTEAVVTTFVSRMPNAQDHFTTMIERTPVRTFEHAKVVLP
jgi:hypothetical protein